MITCKICQSLAPKMLKRIQEFEPLAPQIRPPDLIVTDSIDERAGREINVLMNHLQIAAKMETEQRNDGVKAHLQTLAHIAKQAKEITILLSSRCFILPAEMQPIHEKVRAKFHAVTRKTKLTDRDLEQSYRKASACGDEQPMHGPLWDLITDLRDRYEEIGPYADAVEPADKKPEESPALPIRK